LAAFFAAFFGAAFFFVAIVVILPSRYIMKQNGERYTIKVKKCFGPVSPCRASSSGTNRFSALRSVYNEVICPPRNF
jgi:hypothetical protein